MGDWRTEEEEALGFGLPGSPQTLGCEFSSTVSWLQALGQVLKYSASVYSSRTWDDDTTILLGCYVD